MLLRLPTDEELSRQRRYQVLKNYVCAALHTVQDAHPGGLEAMLASQRQLRGFKRVRRRRFEDPADVHRALVLGWTSRLQLSLADWSDQSEVLAYANAWAPVHAYYSVYGSVSALLASQGAVAGDHAAVLSAISSMVSQRVVVPQPWTIVCAGCPDIDDPPDFRGLPAGVAHVNDVQLLGASDPTLAWPRLLKALETTREDVLKRRYREWCRQNGRQRTFAREKQSIASKVPPTTMFDVLWRLRVRANYQDAASFVMVTVGADWHREFHDALMSFAEMTSLIVENLLVQHIGLDSYASIADEFCRWKAPEGPAAFVAERVRLLSARSV